MPYKARGKCVYKGNKKVGCTKGSVKKYLTALRIHREMVSADVVGTAGNTVDHGAANTDSYATGDTRIPKIIGGVVRRPGIKTKKRGKLFESKFLEYAVHKPILPESMLCVTTVTNKNLMRITEDLIQRITPDYNKRIADENLMVIEFVVDDNLMANYTNRINGLLNDRINKSIFIQLENIVEGSELEMGQATEKEHKETIKNIKKNPSMSISRVAKNIARDHLKEDPKYYSKLKKAKL